MENLIRNYYNLKYDYIENNKNEIRIKNKEDIYILKKVNQDRIKYLNYSNKGYYRVINNIYNQIYTTYNNLPYILFKLDNTMNLNEIEILKDNSELIYIKDLNWLELWIIKTDYTEKMLEKEKNKLIHDTKDYYLGLAEYSISFLQKNNSILKSKKIIECRNRITDKNYYYPDNKIFDCKEREIAEYIKYLIYEQDNNTDQIIKFIEEVKKRNYNMMLIYARMIFPTYYFDLIEKKDEDISKDIYNLINKKEKFEYITNYFANKYIKK